MKIKDIVIRHLKVIECLRKPSSYKEVVRYLEQKGILNGMSQKTFERVRKDIYDIYDIEIVYNPSKFKYEIINNEHIYSSLAKSLERAELCHHMAFVNQLSDRVVYEKREKKEEGVMEKILSSLVNYESLSFQYYSFSTEEMTFRIVLPLGVKEFKYRWYLIGKGISDGKIRCYCIDRMMNLDLVAYDMPQGRQFNTIDYFKYAYGVIFTSMDKPEDIVLSFTDTQAEYILSRPMHHSQKILMDHDSKVLIQYTFYPTYDFIMDLLSMGDQVEVISPESLREEIKKRAYNVCKLY